MFEFIHVKSDKKYSVIKNKYEILMKSHQRTLDYYN